MMHLNSLFEHYISVLMRRARAKRKTARFLGLPRFVLAALVFVIIYFIWMLYFHAPLFLKSTGEKSSMSYANNLRGSVVTVVTTEADLSTSANREEVGLLKIDLEEISDREDWDQVSVPLLRQSGCKNTVHGKLKVCDSNGVVCLREDLDSHGECCLQNERIRAERYVCSGCDLSISNCCGEYEHCVSCCMSPNITTLKKIYSSRSSDSMLPITIQKLQSLHPLRPATFDVFDYCEHACRHGSHSTHSENSYRGEHSYCFGISKAPLETIPVNSDWFGFKRSKHGSKE